jgi:hypothetical protein
MPNAAFNALSINIYLQPVPGEGASLTTVLYLVPLAANSLNGDTFRTYLSASDAEADATAGYISATTEQALIDAFSETVAPEKILVGSVDLVGGDTYDDALNACAAAGANFYGVCIQSRADADILALSSAVETDAYRIYIYQSDEATWKTAGYPVALAALEGRERTVGFYHDTDAENADLCYATNRLRFDPDVQSAGWFAPALVSPEPLATALDATQRAALVGNDINFGESALGGDFVVSPGINHAARPVDHIVSADWFKVRTEEALSALFIQEALYGRKIPVSQRGQIQISSVIQGILAQGVAAGHFEATTKTDGSETPRVVPLAITSADITAQRLRFNVEAKLVTGATAITVNVYLSQTL